MKLFILNKKEFEADYPRDIDTPCPARKIHQNAFNELITAVYENEAIPLFLYGRAFQFKSRKTNDPKAGEIYFYSYIGEI